MSDLRKRIIDLAMSTAKKEGWFEFTTNDDLKVRVAEYHNMGEGGSLPDPKHYDLDSCITVDMMLNNRDDDFKGGDLMTEETDGSIKEHDFCRGDALVFVSHKAHCVSNVINGIRNVFVVELWKGPERNCPHRCEIFHGHCPLDINSRNISIVGENNSKELPFRLGAVDTSTFHGHTLHKLLWQPYSIPMNIPPTKESIDDTNAKTRHEEVMSLFD